jgi:D-sedoheptulose 7-phosphate isomerase
MKARHARRESPSNRSLRRGVPAVAMGAGRESDEDDALGKIEASHRAHAQAADRFFRESAGALRKVAEVLVAALSARRTLFFFGNGGSAADAQHLAAEFVNRFEIDRPGLPALALTTDSSVLTSIGNDAAFSRIFARQIEALGRSGDVAVGISTSGRSPNVLEGLRAARELGLVTIGLTGGRGGPMKALCHHLLAVPSEQTARVQEIHILAGHILCSLVDDALFPARGST